MIVNFLGDSITEGIGATAPEKNYVNTAARLLGATARNYGVKGTRIARRTVPYREDFEEDFNRRYDRMEKDADFIFVFGGTNDFGHGDAPIGNPEDNTPYTFYGALNILTEKLLRDYGRDKICFILPLHRRNEDDPYGGENVRDFPAGTFSDFVCALVSHLERMEIDYINLNGIFTRETLAELTADDLHPNDRGHKIIAEELAAYLKKKLNI